MGVTFIVITFNQGCRTKGHSQYHSTNLMLSSGQTRRWICCWKVAETIIGTLTVAGNYIRAMHQFHSVHNIEWEASERLHVVWRSTERKTAVGDRRAECRQCSKIERNFIHRSGRHGFSRTPWKMRVKSWTCCWSPPRLVHRHGETCCRTQNFRTIMLCWYYLEDNEAVIKMIIKGRSPTLRHVSRTHRVALDWLFDRKELDPKDTSQIRWHPKPTRWHSDQKDIHSWRMESSSPAVQHYGHFSSLSQPFLIFRIDECSAMSKRVMQEKQEV